MTDELGRPVIADAVRAQIAEAFNGVQGRGALLILTDATGTTTGHVAAKLGDHWKVAAGVGFNWHERKPAGFVGVEAVW